MADAIAVLNAGSSSLKFSIYACPGGELTLAVRGQLEGFASTPSLLARDAAGRTLAERAWQQPIDHRRALKIVIAFVRAHFSAHRLCAVGHRVVHGGIEYAVPVRVDASVLAKLEALIPLAPLHQGHNLTPIRMLLERMPGLAQIACFDTAFHRSAPWTAQTFALPQSLRERGVRRYGFHGLSYEYIMKVLPQFDARAAAGRVVVLHLGNGSSMCAVRSGRSVATTMGFTAADGLPMGTRCGSLDPGVIIYCLDELKMSARDVERIIYHESGLLGMSGISSDMRVLQTSREPAAQAAVDLYCYRIGRELGSLAAALGGLDALVFTAGIGEKSVSVRERVSEYAEWLGVRLDRRSNADGGPRISAADSPVSVWTLPTNEELIVARQTQAVLSAN